jgi:hypothetical protein
MSDQIRTQQPVTISAVNEPAYYEALGRFVEAFSLVEAMLLFTLKTYTKVSWPVARAIFSGTRVETSMDFVNRICDAFDPGDEQRNELKDVFKQLRAINEVRNSLLHYGSFTRSDKGRITSNVRIAHVPKKIKEHPVSLEIFDEMTSDLQKINYHLTTLCLKPNASYPERVADIPEIADAWRYIPAPRCRARRENCIPPQSRRRRAPEG